MGRISQPRPLVWPRLRTVSFHWLLLLCIRDDEKSQSFDSLMFGHFTKWYVFHSARLCVIQHLPLTAMNGKLQEIAIHVMIESDYETFWTERLNINCKCVCSAPRCFALQSRIVSSLFSVSSDECTCINTASWKPIEKQARTSPTSSKWHHQHITSFLHPFGESCERIHTSIAPSPTSMGVCRAPWRQTPCTTRTGGQSGKSISICCWATNWRWLADVGTPMTSWRLWCHAVCVQYSLNDAIAIGGRRIYFIYLWRWYLIAFRSINDDRVVSTIDSFHVHTRAGSQEEMVQQCHAV